MLDLKAETPLTLTQAARLVPLTRLDRPAPVRTILRWILHGVRGVQLEAVRIGGRWVTSPEALERFTSTLTDRRDANRRGRGPDVVRETEVIGYAACDTR
jgi:Protein of unknown function (DUF1580)